MEFGGTEDSDPYLLAMLLRPAPRVGRLMGGHEGESRMIEKTYSVVCTKCHAPSNLRRIGSTRVGATQHYCPSCKTRFLYPMTPTTFAVMIFGAGLYAAITLRTLREGAPWYSVLLASLMAAVALYCLLLDVWRRVEIHRVEAEARRRGPGGEDGAPGVAE